MYQDFLSEKRFDLTSDLLLATSNSKSSGNDVHGVCSGLALSFEGCPSVSIGSVPGQRFGGSMYFDSDIIRSYGPLPALVLYGCSRCGKFHL